MRATSQPLFDQFTDANTSILRNLSIRRRWEIRILCRSVNTELQTRQEKLEFEIYFIQRQFFDAQSLKMKYQDQNAFDGKGLRATVKGQLLSVPC